jgi:hypothetical protein
MPMQAESLEVLERASVAPAQARAIVRAIEIEMAAAKDTLATKHDIAELRGELNKLAAELRGEMAALAADLRGEMVTLGAQLRVEIETARSDLRAEIHRSASGITRQMYTAILGQLAVLLGFAYFFATHVR